MARPPPPPGGPGSPGSPVYPSREPLWLRCAAVLLVLILAAALTYAFVATAARVAGNTAAAVKADCR